MVARLYRRWFLEPWTQLNEEAAAERARAPGFDYRPVVVLIVAALVLVFQEYFGDRPNFDEYLGKWAQHWNTWYQLGSFAWWSGAKVLGYLVVPVVVLKLLGTPLRDCGLETRGFAQHAWIYGVLYLAILPVVVIASFTKPFQATYPFYKLAARTWLDFWVWEAMYASTFLALEFFFRGFLLF